MAADLSKGGAGTLVLSGTNTYTGTTTISDGTLAVTGADALGATSGGTSISTATAILELRGGVTLAAEPISFTSSGTILGTGGTNEITGHAHPAGRQRADPCRDGLDAHRQRGHRRLATQNLLVGSSGDGTVVFTGAHLRQFISGRDPGRGLRPGPGRIDNFTQVLSNATLASRGASPQAAGDRQRLRAATGPCSISGDNTLGPSPDGNPVGVDGTMTLSGITGSLGLTKVGPARVLSGEHLHRGDDRQWRDPDTEWHHRSSGAGQHGRILGGTGTTPALTLNSGGGRPGDSPGIVT